MAAVIASGHAIHVNAAGDRVAALICSVPDFAIESAGLDLVDQGADELSLGVVDFDLHRCGFFNAIADGGFGVEGVGVVADQGGCRDLHHIIIGQSHYEVQGGGLVGVHLYSLGGLGDISGCGGCHVIGSHGQHQGVGAAVVGCRGNAVGGDLGSGYGCAVGTPHHAGDQAGVLDLLDHAGERRHGANVV